jgi:N-acetylglucosamine-6-sulfatase
MRSVVNIRAVTAICCAAVVTAAVANAAVATAGPTTKPAPPKPDVVVIMTDDQPALDGRLMQFMPNAYATFVAHGVTFTDFRADPLCCSARAGFFTGQYAFHHGVTQNQASLLDPRMTLATQLHAIGYHTALVGKYLNHYDKIGPRGDPPGWDDFLAFGDPAYYDYDLWSHGTVAEHHGSAASDYSTDVIAARAVTQIQNTPNGKPLFQWIAVDAPHLPSTVAPRYTSAPCEVPKWKPGSWNATPVDAQGNPDAPQYVLDAPLQPGSGWNLVSTCRQLLAVDDLVGRVRAALSAAHRLDNTILVYSGDNPMMNGSHKLGNKEAPYVEQIPFSISWPAVLGTAPRSVNATLQNIDFAPTICAIAACTMGPYPNGQSTPDGIDFSSTLLNGSAVARQEVFEMFGTQPNVDVPPWSGLDTTAASPLGRWHYVEYATGERELYDLAADPWELVNRIHDPSQAALVQRLHDDLAAILAQ